MAKLFGKIYGSFPTQRQRLVKNNLERVTGKTPSQKQVRSVFAYYGQYYVDAAKAPYLSHQSMGDSVELSGLSTIEDALAKGKGVVLGVPHLGSWEWGGAWVGHLTGRPLTAIMEALPSQKLVDFMVSHRKKLGINAIPIGPKAGKQLMSALNDNHIVCLLCDRFIEGTGAEFEFFNEKTMLPLGPATLAIRAEVPLLPAATYTKKVKQGWRTRRVHHVEIRPSIDIERRGKFRQDILRVTNELTKELEQLIKLAPEQWHLMSPNWPSDEEVMKKAKRSEKSK